MIDLLDTQGYAVVRNSPAEVVVEVLAKGGALVTRDVLVASGNLTGDLRAETGDFWFHTDGVFCLRPPRWVVIHVLHCWQGGALHVLDARPILTALREWKEIRFGTSARSIAVPPITEEKGTPIVRYRADYMRAHANVMELAPLHTLLRTHALQAGVDLGEFSPGDSLVLDNWRVLHRRTAFDGDRLIRRLWLDSDG